MQVPHSLLTDDSSFDTHNPIVADVSALSRYLEAGASVPRRPLPPLQVSPVHALGHLPLTGANRSVLHTGNRAVSDMGTASIFRSEHHNLTPMPAGSAAAADQSTPVNGSDATTPCGLRRSVRYYSDLHRRASSPLVACSPVHKPDVHRRASVFSFHPVQAASPASALGTTAGAMLHRRTSLPAQSSAYPAVVTATLLGRASALQRRVSDSADDGSVTKTAKPTAPLSGMRL